MSMTLNDSPYSFNFIGLAYHGGWIFLPEDPEKATIRALYQLACTSSRAFGSAILTYCFFRSLDDAEQLAWNLCVDSVYMGITLKNVLMYRHHKIINRLRANLHTDMLRTYDDPTYSKIHNVHCKTLKKFQVFFYSFGFVFGSLWVIIRYFSYLWGPRRFPVPINIDDLPFTLDPNSTEFEYAFVVLSICGLIGIFFMIESEMTIFSLFIQINREYEIFMLDLQKLNKINSESSLLRPREENTFDRCSLYSEEKKKCKLNNWMKEFIVRQRKLIRYVKILEKGYKYGMLSLLCAPVIIINCMFALLVSGNLSPDMLFEIGLLLPVLTAIFFICWWSEKLASQCLKVGFILYSLDWFEMPPKIQKDLALMILVSQRPPKITAAKIIEMNLESFKGVIKVVYSCLSVLHQLAQK